MKTKLKKNDEVLVISGKEKGKVGMIQHIDLKAQRVIVKDINMVTRHNKPTQKNNEGSITQKEAPIHISNVALVVKKATKSTPAQVSKIGYKMSNGKKIRFAKTTNKEIK